MAGAHGFEQHGLRRGDSGGGSDRTPRGNTGCHRARGGRRRSDVPGTPGRGHPAGVGDGGLDPGHAPAGAHREGTCMTASELVARDLATGAIAPRPGDVWLSNPSSSRSGRTLEQLQEAKAGRTISVVLPALDEEATIASVVESISPLVDGLVDELI